MKQDINKFAFFGSVVMTYGEQDKEYKHFVVHKDNVPQSLRKTFVEEFEKIYSSDGGYGYLNEYGVAEPHRVYGEKIGNFKYEISLDITGDYDKYSWDASFYKTPINEN